LREALDEQELTAGLGLDVSVKNNMAIFAGRVPNERFKNLLTAMATGINGINGVDLSGVQVDAATAAAAVDAQNPSALAKAALQAIKAEPSLQNNPLDVLQKGTTVVLRGAVDDKDEFEKARALALAVPNVTGVDVSGLQVIEHASELNVTDQDGDVVYTVRSGDTLSHIALHYYGSAGRQSYMKIAEANGISDPNKIRVGQQLKIPGTTAGPSEVLS
jgi:nucleoid-associated protein YgaU